MDSVVLMDQLNEFFTREAIELIILMTFLVCVWVAAHYYNVKKQY